MADDLYEADILEWSQHQADLLRRHAAGDKLNEVARLGEHHRGDRGRGRQRLARGTLASVVQAMLHELKVRAWPNSKDVPHWRGEIRLHRGDAADDFTPSTRQRIDVDALYHRALRGLPRLG